MIFSLNQQVFQQVEALSKAFTVCMAGLVPVYKMALRFQRLKLGIFKQTKIY